MDQSHHQLTQILPLDRLVAGALVELEKLGYSSKSMRRYRTIWQHLIEFSEQENLGNDFTENLGSRFIDAYRTQDDNNVNSHKEWRRHIVFGVKVLGQFASDGRIERTRTDMQKIKIPLAMKKPLRNYEQYLPESVKQALSGCSNPVVEFNLRIIQHLQLVSTIDSS